MIRATRPSPDAQRYRAEGHWQDELLDSRLTRSATQNPHRTAVVAGERRLTYAELDHAVDRFADALADLGVRRGETVSWQLPNWIESVIVHFAVSRLGAVSNPITPINRDKEVGFILSEAASRVYITAAHFRNFDYLAMADRLRASLPALEHVVAVGLDAPAETAISFDDLLESPAPSRPSDGRTADDVSLLLYTSGTTAAPKGVLHSHNTLDAETRSIIEFFDLHPGDNVFMPSPVSHITGIVFGVQIAATLGSTLILQDVWDATRALELITAERPVFMAGATPFLMGLSRHPQLETFDLTSLRVYPCGGADVPASLIDTGVHTLQSLVSRMYGSSEFPSATCSNTDDPQEMWSHTEGRAIGAAQIRIVDDDGDDVPAGQDGDILVRGPELFLGYLDATANQKAFTADGWFDTGDRGSLDERGYLTMSGRKKDIIIRGGENISAKDVEEGLLSLPSVSEVAIVGAPDPVLGERIAAFVVPTEGLATPTFDDITEHLRSLGYANQKLPEHVRVVDVLPRTDSGKVQKFLLRAEIAQEVTGS